MSKVFSLISIAAICHEANRALCAELGDTSQKPFHDADDWQVESAVKGVAFCLSNPDAPPSANHESWLAEKEATGWKYGPVKDAEKKEHPCFVPYEALPPEQKAKDYLFKAIVGSLAPFVRAENVVDGEIVEEVPTAEGAGATEIPVLA